MRRSILLSIILLFLAAVAFAQPAAQTASPQLTWVRYYQVQPGKGGEFMRLMREAAKPMFERLIADKTVAAWGVIVPMTHTDETWTHAVYITLPDWAAVDAMVSAVEKTDADQRGHLSGRALGTAAVGLLLWAAGSGDLKGVEDPQKTMLKPGTIRDVVLRHLVQSTAPPTSEPKYVAVDTYTVKPGREGDATGLFREWAVPILTEVASKGQVGPWGFSTQEVQTTGGWTHMRWLFLSDLSGLDGLITSNSALTAATGAGYAVRLRDLSEPEKHRTQLLRILLSAP